MSHSHAGFATANHTDAPRCALAPGRADRHCTSARISDSNRTLRFIRHRPLLPSLQSDMPQKPARLQYFLLAIVATLALLHAFGSARFSLQIFLHGDTMIRAPFYCGSPQPTITTLQPESTE